MTYAEYSAWCQYRKKYGPINPILRQESGFALIAALINNACGGKAKVTDFLAYGQEDEVMDDPRDFMKMFGASK